MIGWFNLKARYESMKQFADKNASRVNELNVELTQSRNETIELRNKLKQSEDKERNCSFAFDFKVLNVFSIERNIHDGKPCTIFGYLIPKETIKDGEITNTDTVREWYWYCSIAQHEQVVALFKEQMK